MNATLEKLKEKLTESLQAVLPIVCIVLVLCFSVAPISPSILLCLIYSIIDYFNSSNNSVVQVINNNMVNRLDYACAQSWAYAVLIFALVLIVNAIVSRKVITLD